MVRRNARNDEHEVAARSIAANANFEDAFMLSQPGIVTRPEQPYVAIGRRVTMSNLGSILPPLIPQLFEWIARRGVTASGAPFFRYLTIDMENSLDVEVGVPLAAPASGDTTVHPGVLPAGRYASVIHTGPYDELVAANAALQTWARANGHKWAMTHSSAGEQWVSRLEIYLSDPSVETNSARWQTEIAYLLADDDGARRRV
jgi:effector-binding domain-containing protein